ncbi:MAG: nitroreductase [Bordetella sp.]|uniref:nitroreductase n=1 Tax=Bordetella sp. TaxID=28081 RepID=UPI003F7B82EC
MQTPVDHDDAQLEQWLRERYSCRAFRPEPVPRHVIERILELAQRTASWCNCQPWQLAIASGAGTERVRAALASRYAQDPQGRRDFGDPSAYEGVYLERRRESGYQLYEAVGIARGDREAYGRQAARNFTLFDAPHLAVVSSPAALGNYGAIDCGGYVSTFMLAARANGVACIAQAAVAQYPDVLRRELGLADDQLVVCGISFGYEDRDHPANQYRTRRAPQSETVNWIDE